MTPLLCNACGRENPGGISFWTYCSTLLETGGDGEVTKGSHQPVD